MKHQLDFEKPIIELQNKLTISANTPKNIRWASVLKRKSRLLKKNWRKPGGILSQHLTAWQRVQLARHPKRPYTVDYIKMPSRIFTNFTVTGFSPKIARWLAALPSWANISSSSSARKKAAIRRKTFYAISAPRIRRLSQALRLMRLADKFSLPIITLIDTAGAYPGVAAEERHTSPKPSPSICAR